MNAVKKLNLFRSYYSDSCSVKLPLILGSRRPIEDFIEGTTSIDINMDF